MYPSCFLHLISIHAGLISLGVGNVVWFLMTCVIIPVRYLAPRSFAIVSTKREEYVKKMDRLITEQDRKNVLVWSPPCSHEISVQSWVPHIDAQFNTQFWHLFLGDTNLFLTPDQQFQRNIKVIIPLLTKLIHSGDITNKIHTLCRVPYTHTAVHERHWMYVLLACNGPI
jgi:hypothetical protein